MITIDPCLSTGVILACTCAVYRVEYDRAIVTFSVHDGIGSWCRLGFVGKCFWDRHFHR